MKHEEELLKQYPDDWGIKMMHDQWKTLRQEFLDELERRVKEENDDFARETLEWYHQYYNV
jgi:hypothetical protein